MMSSNKNVLILQEYIPDYREAFFDELSKQLSERRIDLTVYAAAGQRSRRDSIAGATWLRQLSQRSWMFRGRRLTIRMPPLRAILAADLLIIEQARRNIDAWIFLHTPLRHRIALWGHGTDRTQHASALHARLLSYLTGRASHIFVYTEGGAAAVRLSADRVPDTITVVQNSVADIGAPSDAATERNPAVVVLGAIDDAKRPDVISELLHALKAEMPALHIRIIGDGQERQSLEEMLSDLDSVTFFGRLSGRDLADAAKGASLILNPGRVGLVAVHGFQLGLPVATLEGANHAPEFEYLLDGFNALVSPNTDELTQRMLCALNDSSFLEHLTLGCRESASTYTLGEMVRRFVDGIALALDR